MEIIIFGLMLYSFLCSPHIYFRWVDVNDSPEHAFIYFIACILMGITLIGAIFRAYYALTDKGD
jgi:hypothetical protein